VCRPGADAVDDACRRALDAEVIDVGLIERMLTRGTGEQLPLIPHSHLSRLGSRGRTPNSRSVGPHEPPDAT
jgi:hypothetical protein